MPAISPAGDNLPIAAGAGPHETFLGLLLRQLRTRFGSLTNAINHNVGYMDTVPEYTDLPPFADNLGKIIYLEDEPGYGAKYWGATPLAWKSLDGPEGFARGKLTADLLINAASEKIIFDDVYTLGPAIEHVNGTFTLHGGAIYRCDWTPVFNFVANSNNVRGGFYDIDGAQALGVDVDAWPLTDIKHNSPSISARALIAMGPDVADVNLELRTSIAAGAPAANYAMKSDFSEMQITAVGSMPIRGIRQLL